MWGVNLMALRHQTLAIHGVETIVIRHIVKADHDLIRIEIYGDNKYNQNEITLFADREMKMKKIKGAVIYEVKK